jgi:hypothetical protein
MARYLLVQVDKNDTADRLRERLDVVGGLKVIAMFGKPNRFCACEVDTGRSLRGPRFGWRICPNCSAPKEDAMQSALINLLDEPDTPAKFRNVFLTIREPYASPAEHYGQKVIDITKEQIQQSWAKIQRRKKRRPRARR